VKDCKVYTGAGWQSLKGPPGPSEVSDDAGNIAEIGNDGLIWVPNPNDLRPTHVLQGGTPDLVIDSSVRGVVYDGTRQKIIIIPFESELPIGHTIWLSGGTYGGYSNGFLEIGADDNTVIQYSLEGQHTSVTWKNYPAFESTNDIYDSPNSGIFLFVNTVGQPDGSPLVFSPDQGEPTKPKRIRVAKGVGFTRLLKRLDGFWDVIGAVEELPDETPIIGRSPTMRRAPASNEPVPPTVSGFLKYAKSDKGT
jgi:hypothetical protein